MTSKVNQKLIVVLGMHRSGTSAITRGLQVLGVELGDRLIPAIEGNNAKGFWEDIDLNAFDNEMLNALDTDWHHLAFIRHFDVLSLHSKGYFLRAVELLRHKIGATSVFGIKDPRIAKLLPFWKEVFSHCQLDVGYVLAVRNPLSVVRSLAQRDSIESERSYLLWLVYVIQSLVDSSDQQRILVDYDLLMQSPSNELGRIGRLFNLEVDPLELKRYKSEFLDQSLRHTVFRLEDLLFDDACIPLVKEIYTGLMDVASDKVQLDSPAIREKIELWGKEAERISATLVLADTLVAQKTAAAQAVVERDSQLANLNQSIADRNAGYESHVGVLERHVGDRDGQISRLNQAVTEAGAQVASLNQAVAERNGNIASLGHAINERDGQISRLNQAVTEAGAQVASLNQAVAERNGNIASLGHAINERDGQISRLNQAVTEAGAQVASLSELWSVEKTNYQCHVSDLEKAVGAEQQCLALAASQFAERESASLSHVAELELAVGAEQQRFLLVAVEVENLRLHLNAVLASASWKWTTPARVIPTFIHQILTLIFHQTIKLVSLPFSSSQTKELKNIVYKVFGFAFKRTDDYQRWNSARQIQTILPAANSLESTSFSNLPIGVVPPSPVEQALVAQAGQVVAAVPSLIQPLPSADGTWEWADYATVKSRISAIKSHRLAQVAPDSTNLIDIGNEPFSSVAARIALPTLSEAPTVSIIIPVFNNLKFTLECLLSVSTLTDCRISYEVILADDASSDETSHVISEIANLRYIRHNDNIGFLRNCNKALEYVNGQYVVYLNNDVQVTDGWLFALHETFSIYPKAGAVGPKFLYPSGHLQEAGAALRHDGTADMVGLNQDPLQPRYLYTRRVDYISGACLMLPTTLARHLNGFSEDFLPCYCEDSDLCLRVQAADYYVYYNPSATIIHYLSKTTDTFDQGFKLKSVSTNLAKLQHKWLNHLDKVTQPRIISFYLPQFHPFPENNRWWGNGFTEWTNVTKAQPNFVNHYQPRLPADLGYYDLRVLEVMEQQAALAQRYGIHGFCYYYYWFGGKRLLEQPIEQMLTSGKPERPFCLCWANENWTRRWDGQDNEVLMAQSHSPEDDEAVINDLIRYFRDPRYIRVDDRPMILIYRVSLFPNFSETVSRWRKVCAQKGIGAIYVVMVESFDLIHSSKNPKDMGCDAAVEFPPLELAEPKSPTGQIINPEFSGGVADYRDLAVRYATRDFPGYTRFKGVMPGWDNTARRQNNSFCFEHATPGAFQGWLEETIEQTRQQHYGDERLVFVNAWNEWAEGAYLEPDRRFGHTFLEAVRNATDAASLLRKNKYWHGG